MRGERERERGREGGREEVPSFRLVMIILRTIARMTTQKTGQLENMPLNEALFNVKYVCKIDTSLMLSPN